MAGATLLLAAVGFACAPPNAASPYPSEAPATGVPLAEPAASAEPGVVHLFDREIDLRPFLAGFPYRSFDLQLEDGRLFYLDARERYTLRTLELDPAAAMRGRLDLAAGEAIGDVDWSTRSLWGVHYVPSKDALWLHADASNDERMNLYRIDLKSEDRTPVAQTEVDYIYAYGFSQDDAQLAYLPRRGAKAPYETCLRIRDLEAGEAEDREVVCDTPELRFTWGRMIFSPDGKEIYFSAQKDGDRTRSQLVRVRLDAKRPKVEVLTDSKVSRNSVEVLDGWSADGDELFFQANDDGYSNLYALSRTAKGKTRIRQITRFRDDIESAERLTGGVLVAHGTPAGTVLELVDPETGKARARASMPGKVSMLDAAGDAVVWSHQSPDVVFELNATRFVAQGDTAQFETNPLAGPSPELSETIVQCRAEAVKIPTFDVDPATGETRALHAFLLSPKRPISPAEGGPEGIAMVRSFYGGDNVYTLFDHVMCAAGVTILSPAVRGSSGFGKDFYAANNGDLGGDEIVDLFYAARWLETRTGLPSERIGVYGRSHGGYATMRAMTFPPETNGRNESYRFGFGLGDAGFSDIEAFWKATNIPDWVVLEAGDPKDPEALKKIRDRSPIEHVDLLSAPIFLLHGAEDWRVPVEGSRSFAEKAKAAGKDVTYVEVAGQGHHVEGLERIAANYQSRFDFLMKVFTKGSPDGAQPGAGSDASPDSGPDAGGAADEGQAAAESADAPGHP